MADGVKNFASGVNVAEDAVTPPIRWKDHLVEVAGTMAQDQSV